MSVHSYALEVGQHIPFAVLVRAIKDALKACAQKLTSFINCVWAKGRIAYEKCRKTIQARSDRMAEVFFSEDAKNWVCTSFSGLFLYMAVNLIQVLITVVPAVAVVMVLMGCIAGILAIIANVALGVVPCSISLSSLGTEYWVIGGVNPNWPSGKTDEPMWLVKLFGGFSASMPNATARSFVLACLTIYGLCCWPERDGQEVKDMDADPHSLEVERGYAGVSEHVLPRGRQ